MRRLGNDSEGPYIRSLTQLILRLFVLNTAIQLTIQSGNVEKKTSTL
jgi:hypothetical protein